MTETTIPTPELRAALSIIKKASAGRCALPILAGARLDMSDGALTITCTDLEVRASATLQGTGAGDGVAIVDCKALTSSIPASKGETTITAGPGHVTFSFGPGLPSATLPAMKVDDWPQPCKMAHLEELATVALAPFADVMPAIGTDQVRPILCQVNLAGHEVAATDSYRLHVANRDASEPELSGMVPGRVVAMVLAAGKAGKCDHGRLAFGDDHVTMAAGNVTVTAQLCQGGYPEYRRLIPESHPHRLDLSAAGPAVAAAIKSKAEPIRFEVNGSVSARAVVKDTPVVEMALPTGATTAPVMTVAFNPRFLRDCLADTDGLLELADPLKPALIRSAHGLRLIMPVRLG